MEKCRRADALESAARIVRFVTGHLSAHDYNLHAYGRATAS